MEQLTQMELILLEELLQAEDLAVKKYSIYAGSCDDADLRSTFKEGVSLHQSHLAGLVDRMRSLNGKVH